MAAHLLRRPPPPPTLCRNNRRWATTNIPEPTFGTLISARGVSARLGGPRKTLIIEKRPWVRKTARAKLLYIGKCTYEVRI